MSARPWYREPMLALVIGLPAAAVVAGIRDARARRWAATRAMPRVRRVAQTQTANLAPDHAAARLALGAELALDGNGAVTLRFEIRRPQESVLRLELRHGTDARTRPRRAPGARRRRRLRRPARGAAATRRLQRRAGAGGRGLAARRPAGSAGRRASGSRPRWRIRDECWPSAPCFHCGEPVPAGGTRAMRRERAFCCGGCEAATAWIEGAGLAGYYRTRTAPALVPEPAATPRSRTGTSRLSSPRTAATAAGRRATTLVVEGIRCAACAWLIERALRGVPGVAAVSVNAATSRLALEFDPRTTPLSQPRRPARAARLPRPSARRATTRARRRASGAPRSSASPSPGLGAMQAMMLSEALYFGAGELDLATRDFFRWITFLVATPVVFYAGWPFLAGAWRQLQLRAPGMDLLVAVSVLLAWAASVVETLRGGEAVYYDAAVMFIFFLLAARHIETEARRRATAALDVLARAQPELALRLDAAGPRGSRRGLGRRARRPPARARRQRRAGRTACCRMRRRSSTSPSSPASRAPSPTRRANSCSRAASRSAARSSCGRRRAARESTIARLAELAARAQAERPRAARIADRVAGVLRGRDARRRRPRRPRLVVDRAVAGAVRDARGAGRHLPLRACAGRAGRDRRGAGGVRAPGRAGARSRRHRVARARGHDHLRQDRHADHRAGCSSRRSRSSARRGTRRSPRPPRSSAACTIRSRRCSGRSMTGAWQATCASWPARASRDGSAG